MLLFAADGIKYNMPDSCSSCHPGASKQWLQAKLDEWQGTVTAKMARVKAKLDALKLLEVASEKLEGLK